MAMDEDFSPQLRRELLDDFYAECDEHLSVVRQALEVLEPAARAGQENPSAVERLYRALHSLKGNAAIAGVRPAEQVAHAMEDILRHASRQGGRLTLSQLELLLDGAHGFEQVVASHRLSKPLPDTTALLTRLGADLPPEGSSLATNGPAGGSAQTQASSGDASRQAVQDALGRGLELWQCTFSPSLELDQQGVNLAAVRAQLAACGEILASEPSIEPGRGIRFKFVLGLNKAPEDVARWEADGVTWEPFSPAQPVSAEESVTRDRSAEDLALSPSHIVRVDLARLDELMRLTGELVIQRSRLQQRIAALGGDESLKEIDAGIGRSLRDLRKAVTRVRLVPIGEIFSRIPYAVRDLAAEQAKLARTVLEGHQTEIDKFLAERLREPLLHLVRNALTHGVETADERRTLGKPPEATLTLRAVNIGESVLIEVRDDGRGVDEAAVVQRARAAGLNVPAVVDANALLSILCAPGFSTRDQADRAAGRGIGMSVVADAVRELGGTLTLETTRGQGTTFTLRLPLTVSIVDALIVQAGEHVCAMPQAAVDQIIQVPVSESRRVAQTEVIPFRDGLLPLVRLRAVFGMEPQESALTTILVVHTERGATGLAVDRVQTRREIVVRPLTDPLVRVPGVAGATELGDGRPILILDPRGLGGGAVRPPDGIGHQERFHRSV